MTNDEAINCFYFAVKNVLELDSLGWLRGRKEAIRWCTKLSKHWDTPGKNIKN